MPVREDFYSIRSQEILDAAFYVQYGYTVSQEIFWVKHDRSTGNPIKEVGVRASMADWDTGGTSIRYPGFELPLGLSVITTAFIMPRNGGTKVHTFDYLTGNLFTYSVPSGFLATAPAIKDQNVYWIEFSTVSSNLLTVRFMRSDCKMGSVVMLAEQVDIDTGTTDVFDAFWGPNITTTRMQVWISHPQSFSGRKVSLAFDFLDGAFELGEIEDTSSDSDWRSGIGAAANKGFRNKNNTGTENASGILGSWNGELFTHGAPNDIWVSISPLVGSNYLSLDPGGNSFWFFRSLQFHQYNFTPSLVSQVPWIHPSTIGVLIDELRGIVVVN